MTDPFSQSVIDAATHVEEESNNQHNRQHGISDREEILLADLQERGLTARDLLHENPRRLNGGERGVLRWRVTELERDARELADNRRDLTEYFLELAQTLEDLYYPTLEAVSSIGGVVDIYAAQLDLLTHTIQLLEIAQRYTQARRPELWDTVFRRHI